MVDSIKIRQRMLELGFTQSTLANKVGISQSSLNQKINNLRPFYLDEALRLADILKIDKEQFEIYFFKQ